MQTLTTGPRPAPKLATPPTRELTTEEKAALWDEACALQIEARIALDEIDRLRFKVANLNSQRDALFTRGKSKSSREVCSLCNFENCVCERVS